MPSWFSGMAFLLNYLVILKTLNKNQASDQMNYQQTIEYLFLACPCTAGSVLPLLKDLTNTITLCEHLGDPHHKFKSIHIAGTNGKGSVSHMLAAIFANSWFQNRIVYFTTFKRFQERIKVNGNEISEKFIICLY